MRQRLAGGLEVALHAHLHLARRAQARRIYDRRANRCRARARRLRRANVIAARSVAALAIDSLRQRAGIERLSLPDSSCPAGIRG